MRKIFLLISFIVIFITVHGQAPVNDEPCGAIDITVQLADPISANCNPTIYQYANATTSIGIPNPSCQFGAPSIPNNIRDVWYKCTVPASGRLKIIPTFTDLSGFYNHMNVTVYSGSNCNGTGFMELGCSFSDLDYNNGNLIPMQPIVLTGLTVGSTLYVRLMNAFTNSGAVNVGSVNMCITDYNLSFPIIDNTSKVGIGTSIPYAKLDVAGSGIFRDNVIFAKSIELRESFKIPTGVTSGSVLISNSSGLASWANYTGINAWTLNASGINNTNLSSYVGIGTNSPAYPLNFANTAGDKISLAGSGTTSIGFGVQPGLMQLHTNTNNADIAFGYGSSTAFTERARIINNGMDGMVLKGRLLLQNGSTPLNVAQTPGVWLYKADNSNLLGFMGTQNNQNVGFFGGPTNGGWGFVYDAVNSRVGIGKDNPTSSLNVNGQVTIDQKNFGGYGGLLIKGNTPTNNYPNIAFSVKNNSNVDVVGAMLQGELANNALGSEAINLGLYTSEAGFGSLSQKMLIMGNGNVGLGVTPSYKLHLGAAANGLRIDGPATTGTGASSLSIGGTGDVVIDKPGQVGGRLIIKENGAIAVDGNTGTPKQILTSNGSGASPTWTAANNIITCGNSGISNYVDLNGTTIYNLSASDYTLNITVPTRVVLSYKHRTHDFCNIGECAGKWELFIYLDGVLRTSYYIVSQSYAAELHKFSDQTNGPDYFDLSPGTHTFTFKAQNVFNQPSIWSFIAHSTLMPL
jgi:hypothetical protein